VKSETYTLTPTLSLKGEGVCGWAIDGFGAVRADSEITVAVISYLVDV
jgi:hypothetical protein